MHNVFTFLVAALATSALAAPTPSKQKQHQHIGSFKVPSRARPNALTNVDTLHEMNRAFAKYDFDIIMPGVDGQSTTIHVPDTPNFIPDTLASLSALIYGPAPSTTTKAAKTTSMKHPKNTLKATGSSSAVLISLQSSSIVVMTTSSQDAAISSFTPLATDYTVSDSSQAAVLTSSTSMESVVFPTTTSADISAAASTSTAVETSTAFTSTSLEISTSTSSSTSTSALLWTSSSTSISALPSTSSTTSTSVAISSSSIIVPTSTSPATSAESVASSTLTTSYTPAFTFEPSTSIPATTISSSKKAAGTVNATPEQNDSEYLSPVTIGGQTLTLDFDTGSADLWVFSNKLPAAAINGHTAFDSAKSSTWSNADGSSWKISYGDGSTASGTVGYDVVNIGGATATRQAVELATEVSTTFSNDTNNDGLVGLAWSNINTILPTPQKTFFENIMADLEQPLFTADLRQDASSTYEFGTIDASKYSGDIHYTPIDNSKGFWQFPSTSYSINGQTYQNANAAPAIADTGTSIVLADSRAVAAYYNQVAGATVSNTAGGYVFPCTATVPDFGVAIGTSGFIAVIPGAEMAYAQMGDGTCFGGVQSNSGINYQIFGDILLKQYFAVFNGGAKTFGLAKKA